MPEAPNSAVFVHGQARPGVCQARGAVRLAVWVSSGILQGLLGGPSRPGFTKGAKGATSTAPGAPKIVSVALPSVNLSGFLGSASSV